MAGWGERHNRPYVTPKGFSMAPPAAVGRLKWPKRKIKGWRGQSWLKAKIVKPLTKKQILAMPNGTTKRYLLKIYNAAKTNPKSQKK